MIASTVSFLIGMLLFAASVACGQDVRNVSWGDSVEKVLASEKELTFLKKNSDEDPNSVSLTSNEQEDICGEKATLRFDFYKGRLIEVTYVVDISETGNPFKHDGGIRNALIEKYGEKTMARYPTLSPINGSVVETTVETSGFKGGIFDQSEICSRRSEWILPSHTITLLATSIPTRGQEDMRMVFLEYQSKEAADLEKREQEGADEQREKRRAKDRSKL